MTWVQTDKEKFYLHDDETLLEGLIRTGHNVEYQCKEGYCGSCRTKVIEHSQPINYQKTPLAMIEENEILPCCCLVRGSLKLKIW